MESTAWACRALVLAASAGMTIALPAQAASPIPISDFAKRPTAWEVAMSPTGEYAALATPSEDGSETQLNIVNLSNGSTQVLRFGRRQHVTQVVWTAEDQVVVSRAEMEALKARPASTGELYSSDIKGKNPEMLFGWVPDDGNKRGRRKDNGWSQVEMVLDDEPGTALVKFNCWDCGEEPDTVVFKVNTRTGERREFERGGRLADYGYDQTGEPRLRMQWDDKDLPVLSWRQGKGGAWAPLPKSIAGYIIHTIRFDADNNTAYALVSDNMEPVQAYRIDFAAGTRTKLAGRDDVAVAGFMYEGRNGVPFAVYYDADKPTVEYIKPGSEWAQLYAGMIQSVPGQMVTLHQSSSDGNKIGFTTWSDRNPGSYYVYDRKAKKTLKIADFRPWLKHDALAPMRPVEFTSRSGDKLFGFYTAAQGGPRPLVVMPHGGPFGVYDSWGFDEKAQFLASRGYGVLQVNYRGSGGRGKRFEESGWQGWGTKLQDDIADGVRWAIDNRIADPGRICIFGASFGGYSALIQPIQHPDLYKCAIGYAGVYDLPTMRRTDRLYGMNSRGQRFYDRTLGTDNEALAAISPALHASKVKTPVLLVHGKDDKTADLSQYEAMERALAKAGNPAETFVVSGEGHGFVDPKNAAEMYRRMEAFLEKHIGH